MAEAKRRSVKVQTSEHGVIEHPERTVEVEYYIPADMGVIFTDSLSVLHTEDRFVLSFFQIQPPLLIGDDVDKTEKVRSRCVARLVVTPGGMEKMVEAMQKSFARHLAAYGGGEKKEGE